MILDGAHNAASIRATRDAVAAAAPGGRLLLVFGANRDKGIRGLLRPLAGARRVFATEALNPRSAKPAVVAAAARALGLRASAHARPEDALDAARDAAGPGDVVLITGSLYLAGALRARARGA